MSLKLLSFSGEKSGNVAMIYALALIPIVGICGIAIDYTRASNVKAEIAAAADNAVLSVMGQAGLHLEQKQQRVRELILSQLRPARHLEVSNSDIEVTENGGALNVVINARMTTSFMNVLGYRNIAVSAMAEADQRLERNAEVALVLDVTGSMDSEMDLLKRSASRFVANTLGSAQGQLRMAVVPYIAVVNPGRDALAGLMDTSAASRFHAEVPESWWGPYIAGCDPGTGGWNDNIDGSGNTGGPGNDRGAIGDWLERFAAFGGSLIGTAYANPIVTPPLAPPWMTTPTTLADPRTGQLLTFQLPNGFRISGCSPRSPRISHFDLFQRTPGAVWKGCVEARPEPFDVTDAPADPASPDSMFVPYFWYDEIDVNYVKPQPNFPDVRPVNDYMPDFPNPDPMPALNFSALVGTWPADRTRTPMKYNGTNNGGTVRIVETGTTQLGPNKGCPNEIVPLTNELTRLTNAIDAMQHQFAGGTIISEGVMWGWRVLSPQPPFTQGSAAPNTRKLMVLMSDGFSSLAPVDLGASDLLTDYSAYGPLGGTYRLTSAISTGGFGNGGDRAAAARYLNSRLDLACTNAKAAGITIATVLYNMDEQGARDAMRRCASSPNLAFTAENQQTLDTAFADITSQFSRLRLTK